MLYAVLPHVIRGRGRCQSPIEATVAIRGTGYFGGAFEHYFALCGEAREGSLLKKDHLILRETKITMPLPVLLHACKEVERVGL
jgi:hypothetical protein